MYNSIMEARGQTGGNYMAENPEKIIDKKHVICYHVNILSHTGRLNYRRYKK